jgi:sulfite reductase alpha subunit-like flavoprotein
VLYGSQEGNAKSISQRVHQEAQEKGIDSNWNSLDDYSKIGLDKRENWTKERPILVVTSSTGNGEPPENAKKFWRFIRRKKRSEFDIEGQPYLLLGLGDSNYDTFMGFPKAVKSTLEELGAKNIYCFGEADDATGLEDVVEPWIKNVWAALDSFYGSTQKTSSPQTITNGPKWPKKKVTSVDKYVPLLPKRTTIEWLDTLPKVQTSNDSEPNYTREKPYLAKIMSAKRLTASDATKEVVQFQLDVTDYKGQKMLPGDAFAVVPPNPSFLVNDFLELFKLDGDKIFTLYSADSTKKDQIPSHLRLPCSIRTAFTYYADLHCIPSRNIIRMLAEYANDSSERENLLKLCDISSIEAKQVYINDIETPKISLITLLRKYKSISVPLEHFLELLPSIPCRYYSLSNYIQDDTQKRELEFAFTVVHHSDDVPFNQHRIVPFGICSNWLKSLVIYRKLLSPLTSDDTTKSTGMIQEEEKMFLNSIGISCPSENNSYLPIFPRDVTHFRLPKDLSIPIIMIGTGTGVSPFRGFIQYRKHYQHEHPDFKLGEAWLFYGCRHPDRDLLYPELQQYDSEGIVKLRIAYSRLDPQKVVYVQERLKEESVIIYKLMTEQDAKIYICGEANAMIKDVKETLISIINTHTPGMGQSLLTKWISEKRFLLDIWVQHTVSYYK